VVVVCCFALRTWFVVVVGLRGLGLVGLKLVVVVDYVLLLC